MTRTVTPIALIDRRMAEAGRIRLGRKTAKAMTYLEHFRLTSPTRDLIDQVAALYGGTPTPWEDAKASPRNQWEVVIESDRIDVVLPPNCLHQTYEQWIGSGCVRRCDGEICSTLQPGPEGPEPVDVPCMCIANNLRECKPYTRLNVILTGVDVRGVWRLETKGWNALHELPGMVDAVTAMAAQGRNLVAQLSIAKVERMVKGRKSHFVVPKLELPYTPEQIVSGEAGLTALTVSSIQVPELNAGPEPDDIIDADIVSDLELDVHACADHYGIDGRQLWLAIKATTDDDDRIRIAIAKMRAGDIEPDGFDPNGRVIWRRHDQ